MNEQTKSDLIKVLIRARKEHRLTQEKAAIKLGVSQSRLSQIENGTAIKTMSIDLLLKLLFRYEYTFTVKVIRRDE